MELTEDVKNTVLELNRNAMALLKNDIINEALTLFKKSIEIISITKNCELKYKLLGISQNNLGCYFKRIDKPKTALKYLKKACVNEEKANISNIDRAGTFLNVCAILSALGKHKAALDESLKALALLKTPTKSVNLPATQVIAYHNTAVEYEFLQMFTKSLENYSLAYETALKELGSDHPLTISTKFDYQKATMAIQSKDLTTTIKDLEKKNPLALSFKNTTAKSLNKLKNYALIETLHDNKNRKQSQKDQVRRVSSPFQRNYDKSFIKYTDKKIIPMIVSRSFRIKSLPISPNKHTKTLSPNTLVNVKSRIVATAPDDMKRKKKSMSQKGKKDFLTLKIDSPGKSVDDEYTIEITSKSKDELDQGLVTRSNQKMKEKTTKVLEELGAFKTQAKIERFVYSPALISYKNNSKIQKLSDIEENFVEIGKLKRKNILEENTEKFRKNIEKSERPEIVKSRIQINNFVKINKRTEAAVMIQKNVRKMQCKKIYSSIRNAIILIQRAYREYRDKNSKSE
ncbi:hypothetical protein SteCoe_5057 [Stentor coeruleus]|uniref:Uncharacterized protein n=1 Tax=Stentor coeruleus TaxID=5963 RepID=A0A1R2CT50_9CILI|nr:hypothetical protein SteCoe_5057 [Stentor coeruleus]